MALGDDAVSSDNQDISNGSGSEVSDSANDLAAKVEELNAALANQDKLLRLAAHERKEFKSKYESTLRELESARASVMVFDDTEMMGVPLTCRTSPLCRPSTLLC
jgi:DNA gyrase/topoisomerase IV subunit A